MDRYKKNALWLYWIRGDDEEILTDDELSDLEEENLSEENEIVEIFRIEMDIFDFKTPLCKEFKEFNHLLQIDTDIYERNKEVPWVKEKPWLDDGTRKEPNNDICNECTLTYFLNYEWYEGLDDGDLKDEVLKEKTILEGSWGNENREGKNFCSWLKECFDNYQELYYELMRKLEEYWWGKKEEEESSEDSWINYSPNIDNDAIQADQERVDNREPMQDDDDDDDDIMDLDNYLIPQNASYYVDEEEERFKERKSKLLGIPYEKPPTFKSEKFKVIRYSLGPAEEYVAIKEHEYDIWLRNEENVSQVYQEIFCKKDEG
ncbi:hypothetical protein Tco_0240944 [Tanacetum coccineum]